MRTRAIIATIALTFGVVLFGASPAMAQSGYAWSIGNGARTHFDDSVDKYTVCDKAEDGYRAVGWISVQQADGSWNAFPKEYAVNGVGHCNPKDVEVLREDANLRVHACVQNGAAGNPFNCHWEPLLGS
jgi:hypothetical protein